MGKNQQHKAMQAAKGGGGQTAEGAPDDGKVRFASHTNPPRDNVARHATAAVEINH